MHDSIRKSSRFLALCLALLMCATMAVPYALGEAPGSTDTAAPAAAKLPEDVLATVNGEQVLRSHIQPLFDNLYSQYGQSLPGMEGYLESMALDYVIQNTVWLQKAREFGVDQLTAQEEEAFIADSKAEWNNVIESNYIYYLAPAGDVATQQEIDHAKAQVEAELAQMGYTLDIVTQYNREAAIQDRVIAHLLKDVASFTQEEVQAEYQRLVTEHMAAFGNDQVAFENAAMEDEDHVWFVPEGIRGITHILISVDSNLLNAYLDAVEGLAGAQALSEEGVDPNAEEGAEQAEGGEEGAPAVTQADVDAARQAVLDSIKDKTDDIYARLAAGEAFADLMAIYGEDPGMQAEPYMSQGYNVGSGFQGFIPEFTEGAFAPELAKVGDWGQPIIAGYGVHILYYLRDVPAGAKELTQERAAHLKEDMEEERKGTLLNTLVNEWMESAQISYSGLVDPME